MQKQDYKVTVRHEDDHRESNEDCDLRVTVSARSEREAAEEAVQKYIFEHDMLDDYDSWVVIFEGGKVAEVTGELSVVYKVYFPEEG